MFPLLILLRFIVLLFVNIASAEAKIVKILVLICIQCNFQSFEIHGSVGAPLPEKNHGRQKK